MAVTLGKVVFSALSEPLDNADTMQAVIVALNNGRLNLYAGQRPASPDIATKETLLATFKFAKTQAFMPRENGRYRALFPENTVETLGAGTMAWYRCLDAKGRAVLDGSVGESSGYDVQMRKGGLDIKAGVGFQMEHFDLRLPSKKQTEHRRVEVFLAGQLPPERQYALDELDAVQNVRFANKKFTQDDLNEYRIQQAKILSTWPTGMDMPLEVANQINEKAGIT